MAYPPERLAERFLYSGKGYTNRESSLNVHYPVVNCAERKVLISLSTYGSSRTYTVELISPAKAGYDSLGKYENETVTIAGSPASVDNLFMTLLNRMLGAWRDVHVAIIPDKQTNITFVESETEAAVHIPDEAPKRIVVKFDQFTDASFRKMTQLVEFIMMIIYNGSPAEELKRIGTRNFKALNSSTDIETMLLTQDIENPVFIPPRGSTPYTGTAFSVAGLKEFITQEARFNEAVKVDAKAHADSIRAEIDMLKHRLGSRKLSDGGVALDELPIYVFIGHGEQDTVGRNDKDDESESTAAPEPAYISVPENTVFITQTQCGNVTVADSVCPFLAMFSHEESRDLLRQHPSDNGYNIARILGIGKRAYHWKGPLSVAADLIFWPVSFWRKTGLVHASGVYKFPMARGASACKTVPFDENSPTVQDFGYVYNESVYPSLDKVLKQPHTFATIDKQFKKPLSVIMEELGPGIYYWPICRSDLPMDRLFRTYLEEQKIGVGGDIVETVLNHLPKDGEEGKGGAMSRQVLSAAKKMQVLRHDSLLRLGRADSAGILTLPGGKKTPRVRRSRSKSKRRYKSKSRRRSKSNRRRK